jgi:hypothetical protein
MNFIALSLSTHIYNDRTYYIVKRRPGMEIERKTTPR